MMRQRYDKFYKEKCQKQGKFILYTTAVLLSSLAAPAWAEDKTPVSSSSAISQTEKIVSESTPDDYSTADAIKDAEPPQDGETVSDKALSTQPSSTLQENDQNQTSATTAETTAAGKETETTVAAAAEQTSQKQTSASLQTQAAKKESQPAAQTSGFVTKADGKSYYIDQDGQPLTGFQTIDNKTYYFSADGSLQKNRLITENNETYYIDSQGQPAVSQFVEKAGSFYYLDEDGQALTGWQTVDGKQLYFAEKGKGRLAAQYKGSLYTIDGDKYYFDPDSGELWTNRFVNYNGHWYYLDSQGKVLTGYQTIAHQNYYFDEEGRQLKGIGYDDDGQLILTDRQSGLLLNDQIETNRFYQNEDSWYYLDENGQLATGWQTINGQRLYFNSDGSQVKGKMLVLNGRKYYLDPNSGELWINRFVSQKQYSERYSSYYDVWYYLGDDGAAVSGWQTVDGKQLYFYSDGSQAKGRLIENEGKFYYFDPDSGQMWTNRFVYITPANNYYYQPVFSGWLYLGADGAALLGWQTIDGKQLYFQPSYNSQLGYSHQKAGQIKGELFNIDGSLYYFDSDTGEKWTNRTLEYNGNIYDIDAQGRATLQQP